MVKVNSWMQQSQFMLAVINNDVIAAEKMLQQGQDADTRFCLGAQSRPAVCLCVERGLHEMTRLLLNWGCSINQYDSSGLTSLHLAAGHGYLPLVSTLVQHRAHANAVTNNGQTPLHLVTQNGHFEIIKMLVNAGSDVNRADSDGLTPLMLSCLHGHVDAVKFMMQHGADVNAVDKQGNSPLLHATSLTSTVDLHIIKMLLDAHANVNQRNKQGDTPLLSMIRSSKNSNDSSSEIVKHLISRGCDIDVRTKLGHTALHLAALEHKHEISELLIRSNCELDSHDVLGKTPLFHFAKDNAVGLALMMISAGVDLSKQKWLFDEQFRCQVSDELSTLILHHWIHRFPTLKSMCRKVVRRRLGHYADHFVSSLNLPSPLKNYLCLNSVS